MINFVLAVGLIVSLLFGVADRAAAIESDLRIEAFAVTWDVENHLNTPEGREKAAAVLRRLEATKLVIDLLRSGHLVDPDLARTCRDYFASQGFEVAAGITTAPGDGGWGHMSPTGDCFCYTHEKTQTDLADLCRRAGEDFDEIIVDDFFMTFCTCPLCERARGARTWEEYRAALMSHVGRNRIVRPAHEANPQCRVIIKYPQWYDKFHEFGYNPELEGRDFDAVWVGTETRDPNTLRYGFVQQFQGFMNFAWIASFHPEKTLGAWYDHGDTPAEVFVEQGYQSVLAGAQHLTLFHLHNLLEFGEVQEAFVKSIPTLRTLRGLRNIRDLHGVYVYKPLESKGNKGEYFIFDYLGMLGFPVVPCHEFPKENGTVFLSSHALKDPYLLDRMLGHFQKGGSVVVTPALLESLACEREVRTRFGYQEEPISRKTFESTRLRVFDSPLSQPGQTKEIRSDQPIRVSFDLHPLPDTEIPVRLLADDREIPLFTERATSEGGRAMVLNLSTFSQEDFDAVNERFLPPAPVSFLDMPELAVSRIRSGIVHRDPFLVSAPTRVSSYLLGEDTIVIENFRDGGVGARLRLDGVWKEILHHIEVIPQTPAGTYVIAIPPREIVALQRVK